jgi:hypothetical protein
MRIQRSLSTMGVALVAAMLAMSAGGGAYGQETSPGASSEPPASSEPGASPPLAGDLCARFEQAPNVTARTARRHGTYTQAFAQTDEHLGECAAPRWDPTGGHGKCLSLERCRG